MAFTAQAHLRAVINTSRDFNWYIALVLLLACASALGAGLSDNSSLTTALTTGSNINEATKEALLSSAYLPRTLTVRALAGLTTGLGANTVAQ